MNEAQIRQIVRDEINKSNSGGRFTIQNLPFHTHNGIDSPYVYSNTYTYLGGIASDGTIYILPKGWTATRNSTGIYQVVHNLNTNLYCVSAVPIASNVIPQVNGNTSKVGFIIGWTNAAGTFLDTNFMFTVTAYTATATKPPLYANNI